MAGTGPLTQDWEPVVIRKKPLNAAAKKDEKTVNAARRAGAEIETLKKCIPLALFFPSVCFQELFGGYNENLRCFLFSDGLMSC